MGPLQSDAPHPQPLVLEQQLIHKLARFERAYVALNLWATLHRHMRDQLLDSLFFKCLKT